MDDYTHLLYESLLNQYPYTPSTPSEYDAAQRMETARTRVKRIPKAYRHNLFELTDSLDILTYYRSHHAFLLGLAFGLSMTQALTPFSEIS